MEALPEVLQRLLRARGIDDADWEKFLNPSLRDLSDPDDLPGVARAADVILASLDAGERIVVFGDYDCDGVCATAILVKVLTDLATGRPHVGPGRRVPTISAFIPERLGEGYGMSDASVARMLKENPGVGLVVTVDNGINSIRQVALLKARGVSVVITDHHLPSRELRTDGTFGGVTLPNAEVVVDPKVLAPPHLAELCGAGVAFFLANRLVDEARRAGLYDGPKLGGPLLVLAGLATVTDIMPVLGQNRILVAEALRNFERCAPKGLQALRKRAARNAHDVTSRDFGFLLGPRINAAGRMASAMDALDLILEEKSDDIANEYARRIDDNNTARKTIEQDMTKAALAKVVEGAPAQVIDLPEGNPGVAGIVAARVMEQLGETVPVCVIAGGHGSGRAPEGFNIRDAFVACRDVLANYGGHAAAGGFSVKTGLVDRFREMLVAYCEALKAKGDFVVAADETTDLWLEPADVTLGLAEALNRLEPYGEGNPEPVFGLRGVTLRDVKLLGTEGRHLSATVAAPGLANPLRAVWWGAGDRAESLRADGDRPRDVRFTLVISDYGERHVEISLKSAT